MARDFRAPDLGAGTDTGHFGLVPIDVARGQLGQSGTGIGRSFVDAAPRAGLAILSPFKAKQTTDPTAVNRTAGTQRAVPLKPQW